MSWVVLQEVGIETSFINLGGAAVLGALLGIVVNSKLKDRRLPVRGAIPAGHKAARGDGLTISASEGVVPIIRELERGKLQVIGTGFYITRYGLFLTARHVFDHVIEAGEPSSQSLLILHDTGEACHIRMVKRITWSQHADIALGEADNFLAQFPNDPLMNLRPTLTLEPPYPGSGLATFAYPRNELLDFTMTGKRVKMFADRFDGGFQGIREPGKYDKNGIELYQSTIQIEGGASGGPVFDQAGRVVAIARSSLELGGAEHEGTTISFLTPIRYCLDLGFNNLLLPSDSWELRQVPENRRGDTLTIRDLVSFGHVLFDAPM